MKAADQEVQGKPALWSGLRGIYAQLRPARRRQFYRLVALIFVGALAELATIGAVIPFLTLLARGSSIEGAGSAAVLFRWLGAGTAREQLLAVTILFAVVAVAAASARLTLLRAIQNFVYGVGHEISVEVQRRILFQPYSFHIHRNTSSIVSALEKNDVLIFDTLMPLTQAASAAVIAIFIIAGLIAIDPIVAIITAAVFSAIYLVVTKFAHRRLVRNSEAVVRSYDERVKIVQESLGGIRDVIVDNNQAAYLRQFEAVDSNLSAARASTNFISGAPRFVIESLGMVAIAGLALVMSQREGGLAAALPILGAIALGTQRVLPLIQQIYNGWSLAAGSVSAVSEVLALLRLPLDRESMSRSRVKPLPLRDRIALDRVSFAYPTRRGRALSEVTIEIPRGSMIALTGPTGSGKSTLADLLMGLVDPDDGRVLIDSTPLTSRNRRRWQRSIGHVPQAIFLSDSSIASNIAFGVPKAKLDLERVADAARKAQIDDFIRSLPDGYHTPVGERGVRLSGGQRQRLGIARAIYKDAPVLILDEATSALDDATEAAVIATMEQLRAEGRTIVVIAHRASTISRCDHVVRLHNGRLVESTTAATRKPRVRKAS